MTRHKTLVLLAVLSSRGMPGSFFSVFVLSLRAPTLLRYSSMRARKRLAFLEFEEAIGGADL